MYIFSVFLPEPGIEARMPIVSGCLAVSQMLMVAQSSGDLSTVGPVVAAPASRGRAAQGDEGGEAAGDCVTQEMHARNVLACDGSASGP